MPGFGQVMVGRPAGSFDSIMQELVTYFLFEKQLRGTSCTDALRDQPDISTFSVRQYFTHAFLIIIAMPWPTPIHIVHSAYVPPPLCS